MGKCYFEARKNAARGNSISTDMMRHLHTRQYLGKTVIISNQPSVMLSAARKQWLKLSRYIQKQRAATLDADKILKYTHTVTHMQHMNFSAKAPLEAPDADVYFVSPKSLKTIPTSCQSVYLGAQLTQAQIQILIKQLPDDALVIDYADNSLDKLQLTPKAQLEINVEHEWRQLEEFLTSYHIDAKALSTGPLQDVNAMEEALDILLGASHRFLQIAGAFQRALELARPLRLSKSVRQEYDAAALLAHRVQALGTNGFTGQFLEAYNEDDTFFLYDRSRDYVPFGSGESLSQAIARHIEAGRHRLAAALTQHYQKARVLADTTSR